MSKKKREIQCWACGELGQVRNQCKDKKTKFVTKVEEKDVLVRRTTVEDARWSSDELIRDQCGDDILGMGSMEVDYFNKWTEAYAVPNQEATTVAEVLVKNWVCRFGVPLEIHSKLFQKLCDTLGIR